MLRLPALHCEEGPCDRASAFEASVELALVLLLLVCCRCIGVCCPR
jgi:hypothetical protein